MVDVFNLDAFLRTVGWPQPDPATADRMQAALRFFREHLHDWGHLNVEDGDKGYRQHGPNPWLQNSTGRVTKLMGAMQAINFDREVRPNQFERERHLRRYGTLTDRGRNVRGVWYTDRDVPAAQLALPPGQDTAITFVVQRLTPVLVTTAGDLMVDWGMAERGLRATDRPRVGKHYFYRAGGGIQYLIPRAKQDLQELGVALR